MFTSLEVPSDGSSCITLGLVTVMSALEAFHLSPVTVAFSNVML